MLWKKVGSVNNVLKNENTSTTRQRVGYNLRPIFMRDTIACAACWYFDRLQMQVFRTLVRLVVVCVALSLWPGRVGGQVHETLWLEAEHFVGIEGYCWPLGDAQRNMDRSNGHWGLSGPGWAAEWNQGGESNFLSIAAGAAETAATVARTVRIPAAGDYSVWIRYGDWREQSENFSLRVRQPDRGDQLVDFGAAARVEEDNEMKLYWGWAFAWDRRTVSLQPGVATIELTVREAQQVPRQVDVVVLTQDESYVPLIKNRPRTNGAEALLDAWRADRFEPGPPLARRNLWSDLSGRASDVGVDVPADFSVPDGWQPRTFADKGFVYLWNVSHTDALSTWLGDAADRVLYPYNVIDPETRGAFEAKYGGQLEVPIFSDSRVAPAFHGVGAGVFATDPATGELLPLGQEFAKWLERNPDRRWGMMMNYHAGAPIGDRGVEYFQKYRDRYVGSIAGESLGYFYPDVAAMRAATDAAATRRQLVEAFAPLSLQANAAKYRAVYGRDVDPNPYADVISCHSIGSLAFTPLCFDWGARTVGYESSAATSTLLSLRWAAMRGGARQFDGLTATYRSCNFGDSSTIFSKTSSFSGPENILDNYYSVYSGAGITWYKFDLWYQYMAGSSMFYHEQGFDEFWQPGGTTAAGKKEVQLSPKGKLVDRFLRTTTSHPERGAPVTPIAFLMDYSHGWEPATFWPNSFVNWHQHPDRFLHSDHEQMIQEWLWAAYYPIGRESEKPITALNEVFVPGVFGDIFDCIFAYPQLERWTTIDTYPVVIALGELELSAAEAERLNAYVERGGTLVVSAEQLTPAAAAILRLPGAGEQQVGRDFTWPSRSEQDRNAIADAGLPVAAFEFSPIAVAGEGPADATSAERWLPLATSGSPQRCFCAWADRGKGRIVYLSVPRGLTISRSLHPVAALLLIQLVQGQMPMSVTPATEQEGIEWFVNRGRDAWYVTLMNPAGQAKPQQGITPTDYTKNVEVTIQTRFDLHSAVDWLAGEEVFTIDEQAPRILRLTVPAGGVRVLELR